jgi:putative Ca2+/H+ antiporter (TMEM165/GDT1 family)
MSDLLAMFVAVFVAEFGDKTQLATVLFASERKMSPLLVFVASGGALLLSTALATFFGTVASRYLAGVPFKLIAGIGFILIGAWTVLQYYKGLGA